jgi:S-DNA-T family DNA segregation ATPase FtsK/SpoIIIE
MLQRKLHIGYPRAARLLDQLEEMGLVGPSMGGGRDREVLIDPDDMEDEQ